MGILRLSVFLTFVLACCVSLAPAHAAKTLGSPDLDDAENAVDRPENEEEMRRTVDIAPPPPLPDGYEKRQEYFHKYHQALTAHIGLVYDTKAADVGTGMLTRVGAQYLFQTKDRFALEGGADLLTDGSGSIQLAQRKIWGQSRFRPYIKAGAAVRIVPSDQLATFLKHENYQARFAGGFERLVKDPYGARVELELMVSARSQAASLLLGGVWSF